VLLLDARPRFYYDWGHIPGALPLAPDSFPTDYACIERQLGNSAGKKIVVYCGDIHCPNAHTVATALVSKGYTVTVFPPGWLGWQMDHSK